MHAVIRTYSGPAAKKVIDLLEERNKEVENVVRSINGVVSYTLLRSADGGASITVCRDKAAADEMSRAAANWMQQHASHIDPCPPAISEGSVILQIS